MSISRCATFVLIFMVSLVSQWASANDSSYGDDNGTITLKYQPDISMDKEFLYISEKLIRVEYIFKNTSSKDLQIPVAFPMPPLYFGSSDHTGIKDFKLWVNGELKKTERKLVVLLDGKIDISEKMAKSRWSVNDVEAFVESGEIPRGKKPLPAEWLDKYGQPRFTMSYYFVWQQSFPANQSISIQHSYEPSISTGIPQPADFINKHYAKDTCLDASAKTAIKRRESEYGVEWANLRYILTTGNNWQGPIKDFHLVIKKEKSTDVLSLCLEGELKKTDALTFEFRQTNFKPQHDLNLLFVRRFE
jgi:hypothetical protein